EHSKEATENVREYEHTGGWPNRRDAGKNFWHGAGTEDENFRMWLDAIESTLDIISGSIADGTGILCQNKVGSFLMQPGGLDVKGALRPRSASEPVSSELSATQTRG